MDRHRTRRTIRVFHRTSSDAAADIRIMGFYDATSGHRRDDELIGVRVSNTPVYINEDGYGDALLTLRIPAALFERYESTEPSEAHREAVIPAEELNSAGQPRIVSQAAEDRWNTIRLRVTRKS